MRYEIRSSSHFLQEKESRFGWWDGIKPVTPPPYKDEDVEEAEKEKERERKKKREFLEKMKRRKMELEKEKEENTAQDKSGGEVPGVNKKNVKEETGRTDQSEVRENK